MNDMQLTDRVNSLVDSRIKSILASLDRNTGKMTTLLADIAWSAFQNAAPLTGTEKWVGLQSGINVQGNISDLIAAPPGNAFTPVITLSGNVTAASGVNGFFSGNKSEAGGIVNVTMNLLVTSDNSGGFCELTITTPLPANFTDFFQAEICGNPLIVLDDDTSHNNGAGWGKEFYALNGNSIYFKFEVAELNKTYRVNASYIYQIQS